MDKNNSAEKQINEMIAKDDATGGIELLHVVKRLYSIRRKIFLAAFLGIIIGVIIAISTPKKYTVVVSLSPEMSSGASNGGGLASMAASFLGASMSTSSSDAVNALLTPEIIASTPFLLNLLDSRVVTSDGLMDTTLAVYLDHETIPWWNQVIQFPKIALAGVKSLIIEKKSVSAPTKSDSRIIHLSEKEHQSIKLLKGMIMSDIDPKTSKTILSVTMQDPKVAAIVADSLISSLQKTIIRYRTSKAEEDCNFLRKLCKDRQQDYYEAQKKYAEYIDSNSNIILQSTLAEKERLQNDMNLAYQVYSQVAQQLQLAQSKVQEEKPVFAVIEPSVVPLVPSSTSKIAMIIFVVIFTMALTVFWELFGLEIYKKTQKNIQNINN